jgi:galactokinase
VSVGAFTRLEVSKLLSLISHLTEDIERFQICSSRVRSFAHRAIVSMGPRNAEMVGSGSGGCR